MVEFHCVHNDGPVTIDPQAVNEVRLMEATDKIPKQWTRLRMFGSADVEIREEYNSVRAIIEDAKEG